MSADVLFTPLIGWSVTTPFFQELMQRAIWRCRADESHLVEEFTLAADVHCLSMIDQAPQLQVECTTRLIEAAELWVPDLRDDETIHPSDVRAVEELVSMAEGHLRELRQNHR